MSVFSVTSPASEISLLTIAELRAAAGVTDGSQDAALLALGRQASTVIARRCNIRDDGVNPPTLLRETCSETFRWSDCGPLKLARRPVTSIVSVTLDGSAVDTGSYEAINRDLYYLSGDDLSDWSAGKIIVSFVAGFATAPLDLKLAASKVVTSLNAETARDPSLKREDIYGVIEREYWVAPADDPLFSKEISDLLSPYVERYV